MLANAPTSHELAKWTTLLARQLKYFLSLRNLANSGLDTEPISECTTNNFMTSKSVNEKP